MDNILWEYVCGFYGFNGNTDIKIEMSLFLMTAVLLVIPKTKWELYNQWRSMDWKHRSGVLLGEGCLKTIHSYENRFHPDVTGCILC